MTNMSVKKMVELYVTYELSEETWSMMYQMRCHGLISYENWVKFYEKCKAWHITDDGQSIEDENGKIIYTRDANGFLVKAA